MLMYFRVFLFLSIVFATMTPARAQQMQRKQGPVFIENKGQWDSRVRFLLRTGGLDTWITDRGVVYDLYQMTPATKSSKQKNDDVQSDNPLDMIDELPEMQDEAITLDRHGHVVGINFLDASVTTKSYGSETQPGHHNYFIGNDRSKWATNVALYGRARIEGLYPGIDAVFYLDGGKPRYDLIVKPGANPEQIRMSIEGAKSVKVNAAGSLSIETSVGVIEQRGLFAYQSVDGKRQQVKCNFVVDGKSVVRFAVGSYNRTRPLVLDPLVYSTYLGGSDNDFSQAIAVDASGNANVTGYTFSTAFPTTTGAYQSSNSNPVNPDVFITKLNALGNNLVYSTYLGGSEDDRGCGIAVDVGGNAYITGYTSSSSFPIEGAYQATKASPLTGKDAFVTKLSANGSILTYSTYLGGSNNDLGRSITVDVNGNAYICGTTASGTTASTSFPLLSAFQSTLKGGVDAFVTKLNVDGDVLVYSSYLGGDRQENGFGIAVDVVGNAYITGRTYSSDIATSGAYQVNNAGIWDAFLTKLDVGGTLVYTTCLGGTLNDYGYGIAVDGTGAYVTGFTYSIHLNTSPTRFPTSSGVYQSSTAGGSTDAFVTKFNSDGTLAYSTYLGGNNIDVGEAIAVDGSGNAYITGRTYSANFPTTSGALTWVGSFDAFVTKLNSNGSNLVYSTCLGGGWSDLSYGIAVDAGSNAYITGRTLSPNFPTTLGVYQSYNAGPLGTFDVFVAKIGTSSVPTCPMDGATIDAKCCSATFMFPGSSVGVVAVDYSISSGSVLYATNPASISSSPCTSTSATIQPASGTLNFATPCTSPMTIEMHVFSPSGSTVVTFVQHYATGEVCSFKREFTCDPPPSTLSARVLQSVWPVNSQRMRSRRFTILNERLPASEISHVGIVMTPPVTITGNSVSIDDGPWLPGRFVAPYNRVPSNPGSTSFCNSGELISNTLSFNIETPIGWNGMVHFIVYYCDGDSSVVEPVVWSTTRDGIENPGIKIVNAQATTPTQTLHVSQLLLTPADRWEATDGVPYVKSIELSVINDSCVPPIPFCPRYTTIGVAAGWSDQERDLASPPDSTEDSVPGNVASTTVSHESAVVEFRNAISLDDSTQWPRPIRLFYTSPSSAAIGANTQVGFRYTLYGEDHEPLMTDSLEVPIKVLSVMQNSDDRDVTKGAIAGVYPNPAEDVSRVSYVLDTQADIMLELCDLAGRPLTTLARGWRSAGTHDAQLQTGDLPSGAYLLRLRTGGGIHVQQVRVVH